MKKKKLIVQIAEGLGNQLFMYAHSYSLSKDLKYDIEIDCISGYKRKKNLLRDHQKYLLNHFKLETPVNNHDFLINNKYNNILKKFFLFRDNFKKKKTFYIEPKKKINNKKIVNSYFKIDPIKLDNKVYVIGNFENPEYFNLYKDELNKKFQIKEEFLNLNNPIINDLKKFNSVSIHLRRDKFSDQSKLLNNSLLKKSEEYTGLIIEYINKSIKYFKNNIDNPKFFIWTNNKTQIEKYTNQLNISDFIIIKNNNVINDFYLFQFSKHFIVSPSTFHWWGAWLNQNKNKICVRPSNLNPSNNLKFWPNEWVQI